MSKFYSKKKLDKIPPVLNFVVQENLEKKNIVLQQRIYDMKWTILACVELLEKGNSEKALKLLKKVVYEK